MVPLLITRLDDVGWFAVGVPPRVPEGDPLSFVDVLVVVGILVLALYCCVRLAAWLEVKGHPPRHCVHQAAPGCLR